MDEIIEKIVTEMKKQGISATKLETDTEIGKNTIAVWKRGTQPTVEKLIKVIKYLGLSADQIFEIEPQITTPQKSQLIKQATQDLKWIYKCLSILTGESDTYEMIEDALGTMKYIEKALEKYETI